MTDYNVAFTVPTDKNAELIDALRWHWGQIEDPVDSGNMRDRTPVELKAKIQEGLQNSIRDIFKRYKVHLRDQIVADTDIEIT